MATKLQELQSKLTAKQNLLQSIYSQSKKSDGDYDFTKAEEFSHVVDGRDKIEAQKACIDLLNEYEAEASAIFDEVKTLQEMRAREEKLQKQVEERRKVMDRHVHPDAQAQNGGPPMQLKSLGQLIRENMPEPGERRGGWLIDREFKNWTLDYEVKTLFQRTAGWAPESTRTGRFVEYATRPLQLLDFIPVGNTSQALVKYMEETTFTNNAVEVAEGVAPTEAVLAETERSVTVQKISEYLTVTEEQLADVDQVADYVDSRMRFMIQQRMDGQIVVGDGTPPNLIGIINASPQSQARGADDATDAIYKAIVKVRVVGQAMPNAVIIHPTNFQPIRLMRANGMYVWGHPSEVGPVRLWGLPIVESQAITLNTAVTGDFANFCQLVMRQGVEVQVGYSGTGFIEGKQVVRATLRAAMCWYRPSAFCLITGLT
jgi:HK97 family phage major capsid protein